MHDNSFFGYVGEADFHDGEVVLVEKQDDSVLVRVRGYSGKIFNVHFSGVRNVKAHRPEGMILYSLSEMIYQPPYRRFDFTNWDDESESFLQIDAVSFSVCAE